MNSSSKHELHMQQSVELAKQRAEVLTGYEHVKANSHNLDLQPELAKLRENVMSILKSPDDEAPSPYEEEISPTDIKYQVLDIAKYITQNESLVSLTASKQTCVIETLIALLESYYTSKPSTDDEIT